MIQAAQLNLATAHTHGKCWFGIDCRAVYDAAIAHTEAGAMPGALYDRALVSLRESSFVQRSCEMGACCANGVNGSALF